jgi:restriction endonuclease S subunit
MSSQLKKSDDVDLDECFSIYEFGVADFPNFGYLAQPSKQLDVPKEQLSKKDFAAFIQPLDILLAIKGSVAKVAITPESVSPAGDGGWMVNQSCVILRSPKGIEPKVLFMYLRSDVGQCYLQKLVSGATIPMISLTMLRTLQIIIPTIEESKGIIEAFEEQVQRQAEIQRLRSLQEETDKRYWSISV